MPTTTDILLTGLEEGADAQVETWLKQVGDAVAEHEPVVEITTDKVTMEVAAPAAGTLVEIVADARTVVAPGALLGRIAVGPPESAAAPGPDDEPAELPDLPATAGAESADGGLAVDWRRRYSPLVKRMLAEHDLDPERITGTGRGGRITHADVKAHLAAGGDGREAAPRPAPPPAAPASSAAAGAPAGRRIPHTSMRRRIADRMVESALRTAPHVTALFEADFSAVAAHRAAHQADFAERGVRLTYTAYLVHAAVQALLAVPEVNSRWHDDALEVFDDCNVGVATALGREGLVVPVIHQAQHLGLFGLAARLQALTEAAREGRLARSDVQHGTFTLTNHGVSGSLLATPIIQQPQSAILGVGKLEKRVKVVEERGRDTIQILPMAYVTLTLDHRALDGFQANTFLSRFVEVIEGWSET